MSKVFAYVRVSTVKQGERGVSLQEQRDAIIRYCTRESLEITNWFEERQTAAKRGRPIFAQMLKLLSRGKADGIVIHKIDRSARNLRDWASIGELIDKGIKIHFANESLDLHTRGGRLSADIQAVVAADFIRNLREETRKGFYGRLKQGYYPLPAPLGYRNHGGGQVKTPDPKSAPLVKRAFELYATGRYTLESLRSELDQLGLRNRRGTKLSLNGLSYLLHNPFYIGLIRIFRTGECFAGNHEPLIGRAVYERVQALLAGKTPTRKHNHELLYQRLLRCRLCTRTLSGEVQKGHVYYRCHTRDCPTKTIREEAIEAAIMTNLRLLEFSEEERSYFGRFMAGRRQSWELQKTELVKGLTLRLKRTNDRLTRLTDAYLDQAIDRETFEERKRLLLIDRLEIEQSKRKLDAPENDVLKSVREIFELANTASRMYVDANRENKRQLLRSVTSNLTVDGKNLAIALSSPLDLIANRRKMAYGDPKTWISELYFEYPAIRLSIADMQSLGFSRVASTVA